jgi:hypothetical protein
VISSLTKRITSALGVVVLVCFAIRLSYWVIAPVFSALGAFCVVVAILWLLLVRR